VGTQITQESELNEKTPIPKKSVKVMAGKALWKMRKMVLQTKAYVMWL